MNISLFSISGLILSSTCFLLTFIILFFSKSTLHLVWALFNIAVGLWGLGAFLNGGIKDSALALLIRKKLLYFAFAGYNAIAAFKRLL